MNLIFKVIIAWIFAFGVGSFVYLANADEQRTNRIIENPVQDGNLVMRINDGGVKKDSITITGSTGEVIIGPSGSTSDNQINGNLNLDNFSDASTRQLGFKRSGRNTAAAVRFTDNNDFRARTEFLNNTAQSDSAPVVTGSISVSGGWTFGTTAGNQGHQVNGIMHRIRNSPDMTNGVPINVLDFTGLPAGMYLVSGKRTGVSVGTNGLFWVGWTGTSGVHYNTIAANGLSAPTFSGTFFNVTSNSSTQHYFYAQTMAIDF